MFVVKSVFFPPKYSDGTRVLINRDWPNGLTRQEARIDRWYRNICPSTDLQKWLDKNKGSWAKFRQLYSQELSSPSKRKVLEEIRSLSRLGKVTLLFNSSNETRNNATALKELLKNGSTER